MELGKAIVLGATGYIGTHLCAYLRRQGYAVQSDATHGGGHRDLSRPGELERFDWDVTSVFLMAGRTGTKVSFEKSSLFIRDNINVLLAVLDLIRGNGLRPRLVFPSSRLVYKGFDAPLQEDSPRESRTVYAAAKQCCESLLEAYSLAYDIPFSVVRIGAPYGHCLGGGYSYGTIGFMTAQARDSGVIRLFGDGSFRRSFTHISDICRILLAVSEAGVAENRTYNMPGEDLSLFELASLIAQKYGAGITFADWPDFDHRIESGSTIFDGARLIRDLQIEPQCRVKQWLSQPGETWTE